MKLTPRTYLAAIAAELCLGSTMLAAYQNWVEPTAPRHHKNLTPSAAAPSAVAPPQPGDDVNSLRERGVRALTTDRHAEAAQLFQQARKADPANPDLAYLTGIALEGANQIGEAIDAFRACKSGQYAVQARDHITMMIGRLQEEMDLAREAEAHQAATSPAPAQ